MLSSLFSPGPARLSAVSHYFCVDRGSKEEKGNAARLLELETVNLPIMNAQNNFDNGGPDNLGDVDERGNDTDDELEQLPDVTEENYGPELNAERLHRLQQNDPNFTSVRIT